MIAVIRSGFVVHDDVETILRRTTIFRGLSPADRQRFAAIAAVRSFAKGDVLFSEGSPGERLLTVLSGRVKVVKTTARGADVILEIFGPGDPVGAVAVYESRPYPASAIAIEPTTCLEVPGPTFFELLEQHPTLVRGLLVGLTHRMMELTNRLAELSGGRVEARFARFLLKLVKDIGHPAEGGMFIPMGLSRQELADMMGTTIETSIRIMSRWGKDDIVLTERGGFLVKDLATLETLSLG